MTTAQIMKRMIEFYQGNTHDICHFLKVYAYAKAIGELEQLSPQMQETLERAAIVHDISCPLCREKYGNADGKRQEEESPALLRAFFQRGEIPAEQLERIIFLVSHHHTYENVDGADYQILLEADYLVNADESSFSHENILIMRDRVFKTASGKSLLDSIYLKSHD